MGERLTAAELGLTPPVYEALIWVRDALDPEIPDTGLPDWIEFDMASWGVEVVGSNLDLQLSPSAPGCGTPFCIGGSMVARLSELAGIRLDSSGFTSEEVARVDEIDLSVSGSPVLSDLFCRWVGGQENDRVAAVAAIDRLLAGRVADPWCTAESEARQ